MEVALSGSHGLIGSALLLELEKHGHRVRRLVRDSQALSKNDIAWSPSPGWDGSTALEGVSAVIHLAGENIASRWSPQKKAEIRNSRIDSTKSLSLTLARMQNPPSTLLCASAIGFYGDRGEEILDEGAARGDGFLSQLSADWEEATKPARDAGIRVVNLRFGVVLSTRGGALAKMLPPFQVGVGGILGDGRQYMSWIAIDDAVGAIIHCLTSTTSGAVNVVAPKPVTNADFTRALGAVLHRPTICPVPDFGARLVFGEMADELLLSSARVIPKKLVDSAYNFEYPELESALQHVLTK